MSRVRAVWQLDRRGAGRGSRAKGETGPGALALRRQHGIISLRGLSFHICGFLVPPPGQAEFSGKVHPSGDPNDGLGEGWCGRPRKKRQGREGRLEKEAAGGT